MTYQIKVELHPLGVVVIDEECRRELLIEGESCCGVSFDELKKIAATARHFEVPAEVPCRLRNL